MRLAALPDRQIWGALDAFQRLDSDSARPICVALSGGGDSLAALIHTCAWAKRAGRVVLALCVDHGLQAASLEWTKTAARMAERLGAGFQALNWTGDKPTTGIPAAARAARHRLLADAARAAGASVIVTGHTADDQAENAVLGQGVLREWGVSPAWPEGRGVFLLRPLLGARRADLRRALLADGWAWIDDPANDDLRYRRVSVRAQIQSGVIPFLADRSMPGVTTEGPELADEGALQLNRDLDARALAIGAVCVGGGNRMPRSVEIDRLMARIRAGETFSATLCGARIAAGDTVLLTREPGRGGQPTLHLPVDQTIVWDGRFELETLQEGLTVKGLAGSAAKLSIDEKAKLRRIDARARGALPLIQSGDGTVSCPVLAGDNAVRARSLVRGRFLSTYGTILSERQACDVLCMAN